MKNFATMIRKVLAIRKRWYLYLLGFASLVWFLIRVIPKPSRAAYPCQRAAFPLASAFVLWVIGTISTSITFKVFRKKFKEAKFLYAALFLVAAALSSILVIVPASLKLASASDKIISSDFIPSDGANNPVGVGRGIYPGRVVWSHYPEATSWNGSSGYWWEDKATNPDKVKGMLSCAIGTLTGSGSEASAIDSLFKYFNRKQGKGNIGYKSGETIAIKVNFNQINAHDQKDNEITNSPQIILAVLDQLVNIGEVSESDIYLYDISRHIPDHVYDQCIGKYPKLNIIDNSLGENGRKPFQLDTKNTIEWSEELTNERGDEGKTSYLPTFVSEADYLINIGNLKGHAVAGVTICAKNHFGTYASYPHAEDGPIDAGTHPYIAVHYVKYGDMEQRPMKTYNALVDIMGHEHLGEKTLLFIVDALYNTGHQNDEIANRYKMEMWPFDNDWMSSIFVSQDGVAIESVGLDFLRCETGDVSKNVYGNVDNYLHEAAMAHNPPSKTEYDPEGDGNPISVSLGVHEHWNDDLNKQYSRNLGKNEGIELVQIDGVCSPTASIELLKNSGLEFLLYPNVVNDYTTLEWESDFMGIVNVSLINTSGNVVWQNTYSKSAPIFTALLNLDKLTTGIYLCKLYTDTQSNTIKLIKN